MLIPFFTLQTELTIVYIISPPSLYDDKYIGNNIYFIDQTFKKIFKTTNGFINHTMVYDGSSELSGMNIVNSGLSKDYLYIFNTSPFGNSKVYQLKRSNDSSTFTQMTGLGTPTQNTIIDSSAKYNSNEIYLLAYSNSPASI